MPNYNFPSNFAQTGPEARWIFPKRKKKCNCVLPVLFIAAVICSISYLVIGHVVNEQKARADRKMYEFDKAYFTFCAQAKADHDALNEKESEALINLCGK